ncbi:MAG: hypothetical protein ACXWCC_18540, partial [Caldimonas sp.]
MFALLALAFGAAFGQTPPPRPDAGSVLQQVQPSVVAPAATDSSQPVLRAPRAVAAPTSGGGAK